MGNLEEIPETLKQLRILHPGILQFFFKKSYSRISASGVKDATSPITQKKFVIKMVSNR